MHDGDLRLWLQFASGFLIMGLGAYVLSVRPRTPATKAFAVFALGWGLNYVFSNGPQLAHYTPGDVFFLVRTADRVAYMSAAVALAFVFPRRLERAERPLLALPGAYLILYLPGRWLFLEPSSSAAEAAFALTYAPAFGAVFAYMILLALRFARATDGATRRQHALACAAFMLFYVFASAFDAFNATHPYEVFANLLGPVLLGVVWLRATRGPDARFARNLALLTFGLALLAILLAAYAATWNPSGALRIASVGVLAYAILRHSLLGIDVKVRWAMSRTTVAAVFIAVFFVASEAAQQFFGETLGSSYVGILAAGALVFAIAPLSKLADRVAEKAVPLGEAAAPPAATAGGSEDLYRRALRLALVDRRLTPEEELTLAELAERLAIGHRRALEIRHDVLRESAGAAAGGETA